MAPEHPEQVMPTPVPNGPRDDGFGGPQVIWVGKP